jgi:hypothetical protein
MDVSPTKDKTIDQGDNPPSFLDSDLMKWEKKFDKAIKER